MRCAVVCLRFLQFVGAKFRLAVATTRSCWICHRMCAAIVSLSFESVSIRNVSFISLFLDRVTLYAEFLPTKQRAKCVVLLDVSATIQIHFSRTKIDFFFFLCELQCFWALGACFEVALALAVAPDLGWRWLLGLSAAPLFIFACITPVSWLNTSNKRNQSCNATFFFILPFAVVTRVSTISCDKWPSR